MELNLPYPDIYKNYMKGVQYKNGTANRLNNDDKAFHDWYRFVLSFPPHLVREYLQKFELKRGLTVLDPFCGTGTTLIEAKLSGVRSIGIEANPVAAFASKVKTNWRIEPSELLRHASLIAQKASKRISRDNSGKLKNLTEEQYAIILENSISPLPLHKALILLEEINQNKEDNLYSHELLAFAKNLVMTCSNLHFGPEVGVSSKKKEDAPVIEGWLRQIESICIDLQDINNNHVSSKVYNADSREMKSLLTPNSIDAVFTSPPYPNEKDYTRTTRLESVVLGFINSKQELKKLKQGMLRSNTRTVYKGDSDDTWIANNEAVLAIAEEIEKRRIALGKTSGFERMYARVTKLYFGGMARHLAELRKFLKAGAFLGYVVGDQASYLRVHIPTGKILSEIAVGLGYELIGINLFRTRFATATKKNMNEVVVVLRWPGA